MLSKPQLEALGSYICPACKKPLGRYHAYPVKLETLLSRLTESVPMHRECAVQYHELAITQDDVTAVWTVKSSSPDAPSGRVFQPTEGDFWIHLQAPDSITLLANGKTATYEEIFEAMQPHLREAKEKAASDDEIRSLQNQVAWLHRYLPPIPPGFFDTTT